MTAQLTQDVHLLVLIHGMWGSTSNLASMHRIMKETRLDDSSIDPDGTAIHVMLPETNQDENTYDGIDWGGERVAVEVFEEIEKLEKEGKRVTRFSVTGYSLGGLVARYLVGILHQRKFFATVTPVNFNTVATPHIGLLTYPSLFARLGSVFGPRLLGRTGKQFYAMDKWSKTGKPLLSVMADPDRVFFQGLRLFPHIRIYANAINDVTVPYMTAYVDLEDPFLNHKTDGLAVEYDDQYFPIMKSFTIPLAPPPKPQSTHPSTWARLKSYTPPLPPPFRVPFQSTSCISFLLLPILFPAFICFAIFKLFISSHRSRLRVKLLEAEDASTTQRLVHIFGQLEREVEDLVDDPNTPIPSQEGTKGSKKGPRINAAQKKMAAVLNALPQLKKERVYISGVRNSHAAIVMRDVESLEFQKIGEGVLRHWADAFVM